MLNILIINGPNLNLLGKRNPEIYGGQSFESYLEDLTLQIEDLPVNLAYYQSNHEGYLIDKLHAVGFEESSAVVINPGGLTHTSIALRDAVDSITTPCVEVHISNIYERESFRQQSYLTEVCVDSIIGKGLDGYRIAIDLLLERFGDKQS